ncbi:MAG: YbjN domain-containing protein [Candidatus Krumholzibacteria bacterium]|nr:YbjN domain-containing protein [Candidatus Krumholzibacteria bacterium]
MKRGLPASAALARALALVLALAGMLIACGCGGSRGARAPHTEPAPAPAPASETRPADAAVVDLPVTADTVALLLSAADLVAVRLDAGSVVLRGDGEQVLVFLEDDGTTLQAVFPFTSLGRGDPRLIARWNATRRFGRAYLDHEDAPILASDLLLAPGAAAASVQTWGRLFLAMAAAFRAEVWPGAEPPIGPRNE